MLWALGPHWLQRPTIERYFRDRSTRWTPPWPSSSLAPRCWTRCWRARAAGSDAGFGGAAPPPAAPDARLLAGWAAGWAAAGLPLAAGPDPLAAARGAATAGADRAAAGVARPPAAAGAAAAGAAAAPPRQLALMDREGEPGAQEPPSKKARLAGELREFMAKVKTEPDRGDRLPGPWIAIATWSA